MSLARTCPAPGCHRRIGLSMYACSTDWKRLPADLKLAIVVAYGRRRHGVEGADQEHETAKTAADKWLAENPR